LIHLETVARSTFKSFATSEAFKKAFIHLQYKLSKKLSRGQTVAYVATVNRKRGALEMGECQVFPAMSVAVAGRERGELLRFREDTNNINNY